MATFKEMNAARAGAVKHRYSSELYTPIGLESMSNKMISSELSKARSILRKRFERAGGLYTEEQFARVQDLLKPLKEIPMDRRQEVLSEIARELSGGHTTVEEARTRREEVMDYFQDAGFDYVDETNFNDFIQFLDDFSWKERDKFFGSETLYDYFKEQSERIENGEDVKLSRGSFLTWLSKKEGRYGTGVGYKEGGKR